MSGSGVEAQDSRGREPDGKGLGVGPLAVRVRSMGVFVGVVALFALGVSGIRIGFPPRVVVTWQTASEVETAGFDIYRGPTAEGPFSRITEVPVPAEGDPLVGAAYRFADEDVAWGQQYFYQLEEVELTGDRNRYEEVVQARAGAGWSRALVGGAALAALGTLVPAAAARVLRREPGGEPKR